MLLLRVLLSSETELLYEMFDGIPYAHDNNWSKQIVIRRPTRVTIIAKKARSPFDLYS